MRKPTKARPAAAPGHPAAKPAERLPKVKPRTLLWTGAGLVAALVVLFILGFWIRHRRIAERERMADEIRRRPPPVQVVAPKATAADFPLSLPADVRAFATTSLYARTNGYLAAWKADIYDRVKRGDLLAVISAPDTDADLAQAQANLNQQKTNYGLSVATEDRYRGLIATQGVTQQQLDTYHANREQADANVRAAAAAVAKMQALVDFERIVAPFDGVVTARNYDVGALISAANIGAGQQLFDLAEDDRLRVFVNVPQPYVMMVKYGQPVDLTFERNFPGHTFTGVVARSAGTLDPTTRTLRTELDFTNDDPNFHIFPGMYGEATFHIRRLHPVLTVPTSALLFEANGKQVAVVTAENKIHFQPIVPGSDFGTEIEILQGLKGDERVVANPGEQLSEGMAVTARAESDQNAGASGGGGSGGAK